MSKRLLLFFALNIISQSVLFGCKGRSKSSSSGIKNTESNECQYNIPSSKQLALQKEVEAIATQYINAQRSNGDAQQDISNLLGRLAGDDVSTFKSLSAAATQASDALISVEVQRLVLLKLAGYDTILGNRRMMNRIGFTEDDIKAQASNQRAPFECMIRRGAKIRPNGTWDFSDTQINMNIFREDACLAGAIAYYVSPMPVVNVLSGNDREGFMFDQVVFPSCKDYKVFNKQDWESAVNLRLKNFGREMKSYLVAAGKMSAYSALVQGQGSWILEGENTSNPTIIEKDGSFSAAEGHLKGLQCLGVSDQLVQNLRSMMSAAIDFDRQSTDEGLQKLANAERAAYAALATPLVMSIIAPAVAGAILPEAAATIASASAQMAFMSLAFSSAYALTHTATDQAFFGGNFLCRLGENLATAGSAGVTAAPFLAMLPVATTTIGGAVGVWSQTGQLGTIYAIQTANTAAAIGLSLNGVKNAGQSLYRCRAILNNAAKKATFAETIEDLEAVDSMLAEATKSCLDGGIDVAFTFSALRQNIKSIRNLENTRQQIGTKNGELSKVSDLDPTFEQYYSKEGKTFWVDYATAKGGKRLGGKTEGAYLMETPSGEKVIAKTMTIKTDELAIIQERFKILQGWEKNNQTAKIIGVGVKDNGNGTAKITFIQKFFFESDGGKKVLAGGDGYETTQIVKNMDLSPTTKNEIATKMVQMLDTHPDGHPGNILWRVTQMTDKTSPMASPNRVLSGNKVIEFALIDPTYFAKTGIGGRAALRNFANPIILPFISRKFNRNWQQSYFREALKATDL